MARFAIAWEHGAGLGHAVSLSQVARGLLDAGHHVDLVWRDLGVVSALLGATAHHPRLSLWTTPGWPGRPVQLPPTDAPRTHADLLARAGYLDRAALSALLKSWLDLLRALQADVLVTDHSPCALLAAKSLPGLRTAQLGNGYFQPPKQTPWPSFRFWDPQPVDASRESIILDNCRAALAACGIDATLPNMADLLRTDLDALLSWHELSIYDPAVLAGQTFIGPLPSTASGTVPRWPKAATQPDGSHRCLAYLNVAHPDIDAILGMLIDAGLPTLLVLQNATASQAARLAPHHHVRLSLQAVDMDLALRQADVVICQGNSGTVLASLSAGRPLLMLPGHEEQWINAHRVCELHAGIALQGREIAQHGVAAMRALGQDGHFKAHARQMAERHPPSESEANLQRLCERLQALLKQHG